MMDCQQAFALLQEILDKEASQIDEQEVRVHLKKCGHCFGKFRLEESIHAFLHEKVNSIASVDSKPEKLESLRMNIMDKLDEIDSDCVEEKKRSFGSSFKIFLSVAAMVLFAGVLYMSNGFYSHNEYYIPIEQAHWTATENISSFAQNINSAEYLGSVERDLNYLVNSSMANYSFVGGKTEQLMGTEVEHIIFSNNDDYISIFIANGNKFEIPDDIKSTMIKNGDLEMFDHNCRGCRLIFHKVGDLVVITASTNKDIDLTQFIPGQLTI